MMCIVYITRNLIMESEKTTMVDEKDAIYVSDEAYEYMVTMENELVLLDKIDIILGEIKNKHIEFTGQFDNCKNVDNYVNLMDSIAEYNTNVIEQYNKYIQFVEQKNIAEAISSKFKLYIECNKELYESAKDRKEQQSYLMLFLQSLILIVSLIISIYSMMMTANGSMMYSKYK